MSPPAWRHTPINQLEQAIALGEALLDRSQNIDDLNEISLKLHRRRRDSSMATAAVRRFTFDPLGD